MILPKITSRRGTNKYEYHYQVKFRKPSYKNMYIWFTIYGIFICSVFITKIAADKVSKMFHSNSVKVSVMKKAPKKPMIAKKIEQPKIVIASKFKDPRANKIYDNLIQKGSPLAEYAAVFIKEADKNALDWTLMPAISCEESSCGKALPAGSNNPFGIGGANNMMRFDTFDDAIAYEGRLLGKNYRWNANKGIQKKYCPTDTCNQTWAENVTAFAEAINQ